METLARWNECDIVLHKGDITRLDIDAIVNAANKWLEGGGGVDGAIHRAGGPSILEECIRHAQRLGGFLETGGAVITTGGNLPARHVIHTVGPVYFQEKEDAPRLLRASYVNSLALAREHFLRGVAFPCISTGAFGYPSEEACSIAVESVREDLERSGQLDQVIFCVFGPTDHALYRAKLMASRGSRSGEGRKFV